jgi:hypothetical protein
MSPDSSNFHMTTITLLGAGLGVMILGIRLVYSFSPDNTISAVGTAIPQGDLSLFLPVIIGGLLTFVGGVRLSLLLRPWKVLLLGVALICATVLGPAAISAHISAMKDFGWAGPVLVPLFIGRILGIIFFATALLRWRLRSGTITRRDGRSPKSDAS